MASDLPKELYPDEPGSLIERLLRSTDGDDIDEEAELSTDESKGVAKPSTAPDARTEQRGLGGECPRPSRAPPPAPAQPDKISQLARACPPVLRPPPSHDAAADRGMRSVFRPPPPHDQQRFASRWAPEATPSAPSDIERHCERRRHHTRGHSSHGHSRRHSRRESRSRSCSRRRRPTRSAGGSRARTSRHRNTATGPDVDTVPIDYSAQLKALGASL
eukprot:NODE_15868_length_1025_cov_4.206013.p1 GENE.NODE_15868_length_1025_cov_4.206013~~NODE_15868_length_1025_cov_4.206013.p1  ORF type:complete len:218 (+),score=20.08 NODE_15868_length_1025_cov_4.206013:87-740(+)